MFSSIGLRLGFVALSGLFAVACAGSDGSEGTEGASALMTSAPEKAGKNCPTGGQALTFGVDHDGNGKLSEGEVNGTSYVCNGTQGQAGAQGQQGMDGAAAAQGEKGDTGAVGAAGADGADGADGTNGVDGKNGADGKNGTNGVNGKDGADGADGAQGTKGDKGDPGVSPPAFGQFLATQVAAGMVVTCTTMNLGASTTECRGMKVDGLDMYLGPAEANAICNAVTGKGYNTASGLGVVPAPFVIMQSGKLSVAQSGNASPMQNLTCNK